MNNNKKKNSIEDIINFLLTQNENKKIGYYKIFLIFNIYVILLLILLLLLLLHRIYFFF